MKFQFTKMMRRYLLRFAFRLTVFLVLLGYYLTGKEAFWHILTRQQFLGVTPIFLLWLTFMLIMIGHLFPNETRSMALRKEDPKNFRPADDYQELELLRFVQLQNVRAWQVMLVWLCFNGIFGIAYLAGLMAEADLFMLTVFFFLCDYICILFFCPFQTVIMKNRCCVNCRIYDWGHFMMFTPMLFIPSFYSWSLFFTSLVVLIHWEIRYAKHPERFWSGSNQTLRCANCQDKTCQIKRRLTGR